MIEAEEKKLKLQILSCHSVLERNLLSLFTEMKIDVFSNGAYCDPKGHKSLLRPAVLEAPYFPEYEKLSREYPKTNLPKELIDPFDVIFIMHTPEYVTENWDKIKHKKVVWYSIGQSTRHVENMIRKMKYEGLRIVRYSPMEQNIPDYVGADAIIRFHSDEEDFKGWNGNTKRVINMTQSLKGRRVFCHYDHIMEILQGFPSLIYGTGNDDLGPMNGGELPFDLMKGALRDNRVFVYAGSWPAPYTLALIEAMLMGIPVVAIGPKLAEEVNGVVRDDVGHFYEVQHIIQNGQSGFISDSIDELRQKVHQLLEDYELAKKIGAAGRSRAIELFGKKVIKKHWEDFFRKL